MRELTGAQLKTARLRAGLSQQQLADKTGFHRLAVGYWERKKVKFTTRYGAPFAFAKALGMKYFLTPKRAHAGWGITECENARLERELTRLAQLHAHRLTMARVRCSQNPQRHALQGHERTRQAPL